MEISESIRTAMQQTNNLFSTAVIRGGKIDALDDVYTLDARVLPPGAAMIEGRAPIKQFWAQAIAGLGLEDARLTSVEIERSGDGVVEIGSAELTLGGAQRVAGKYVVHWKQEDGRWKWHVDIWNMNQ